MSPCSIKWPALFAMELKLRSLIHDMNWITESINWFNRHSQSPVVKTATKNERKKTTLISCGSEWLNKHNGMKCASVWQFKVKHSYMVMSSLNVLQILTRLSCYVKSNNTISSDFRNMVGVILNTKLKRSNVFYNFCFYSFEPTHLIYWKPNHLVTWHVTVSTMLLNLTFIEYNRLTSLLNLFFFYSQIT